MKLFEGGLFVCFMWTVNYLLVDPQSAYGLLTYLVLLIGSSSPSTPALTTSTPNSLDVLESQPHWSPAVL